MTRYRILGIGSTILVLGIILTTACPMQLDTTTGGGSSGSTTNGDVSSSALSFSGTASGFVNTASATDVAGGGANRRRKRPDAALQGQFGSGAVAWLEDLGGARLRDAGGNPYPTFPIGSDGSFNIGELPVGVDVVLVIDGDGDGNGDMKTIINVPKNEGSDSGTLDDATVDPLSTLCLAKLRRIAAEHGINLHELDISPSGLVHRIRDAYEHLFAESGIDDQILWTQLENLTDEQLAALFQQLIPIVAQRGMHMAEGNIALAAAKDVDNVVRAVARILIQGGFMLMDNPGGVDLSFLAALPNVATMTLAEFEQMQQNGGSPAQAFPSPTLYFSKIAEPDRNFANNAGQAGDRQDRGPMFGDYVLGQMAEAFLAGKTVSLGDLHRIVADLRQGMGARLTYYKWNGPNQQPTNVFESADGGGIEINLNDLFARIDTLALNDPNPESFEQKKAEIRQLMIDFLSNTAEPGFDRLFAGIVTNRLGSMEEFAARVRAARAHLPFSRSGPATFFVLATADSFQDSTAKPVTVNIETDGDGKVTKVTYDSTGAGKWLVGFGPHTDTGMLVELVSQTTGNPLHDRQGNFLQLEIGNASIFQAVGNVSFMEAFSDSGSHFPGAPALTVPNPHFNPNLPPDPETNPPAFEAFVLMTGTDVNATPVRVNYDPNTQTATYHEFGRYYMLFDEKTETQSKFALMTESGEMLETSPGDWTTRVLVVASSVQGITLAPQTFRYFFGVEAPNKGYDPTGAPYYDDINGNNQPDAGESSFDYREFLFDANDWRSTRVTHYYRRSDNNGFFLEQEVAWDASTPKLQNGTTLVPRTLKPRQNAFRFGRPNVTINLLAAFTPPEFFNGAVGLNADTRVNPFAALAILNLVFDSIHNVTGTVDWDGPGGPMPEHQELIEAHFFVLPIGDPIQLVIDGFEAFAR